MKLVRRIIGLMLVVAVAVSCDNKRNKEVDPEAEFFRIYDNQAYLESYYPLDIKSVSDGFIILGKRRIESSAYFGSYVMKIDKVGKFVSETLVDEQYVNPLGTLSQIGGNYYFVCMDNTSLEPRIMEVTTSGNVTESGAIPGIYLPVAVSQTGNNLLLLSYDIDDLQMEVSLASTTGVLSGFEEFEIGFGDLDIVELIVDHMTGNGETLPFKTGVVNGQYFYNGYRDYNFNTVFFSFGGSATNSLQGYRDERFVTNMEAIAGNKCLASWAENGKHYVNTKYVVTPSSVAGVATIEGNLLLEFAPGKIPVCKRMSLAGEDVLVVGSTSNSGEMVLYFYEESSGSFIASKNLGYNHSYELGSFEATDDGGLLVSGMILIEGRFPRICVYKLSEDQLDKLFNPEVEKK